MNLRQRLNAWFSVLSTAAIISTNAAEVKPRVALFDFATDENLYRASLAASDFSAALQARLSREAQVDWIEREQLGVAEREMKLALMGMTAAPMQRGEWEKADIVITGRFESGDGRRTLLIEATDVRAADVLAHRELMLKVATNEPLVGASSELENIARETSGLINESITRQRARRGQRAVAFLFINTASFRNTGNELEQALNSSLEELSTKTSAFRLVHFPRSNRSRAEEELVLSGLVRNGPESFQRVADWYVWGRIVSSGRRPGSAPVELPRGAFYRPAVELSVWNGSDKPITVLEPIGTNAYREVANALASKVQNVLTNVSSGTNGAAARQNLSFAVWQQADSIITAQRGFTRAASTVEGRQNLFSLVRILETACFFDPANREAQADRISYRWGAERTLYLNNTTSQYRLPMGDFRVLWKYSQAWGEHVERFGLELRKTNELGQVRVVDVAPYYLQSVYDLAHDMALGNRTDRGFPADVPPAVASAWQEQIGAELVKRAVKVADRKELCPLIATIINYVLPERGAPVNVRDPQLHKKLIEGVWPEFVKARNAGGRGSLEPFVLATLNRMYADEGKPGEGDRLYAMFAPAKPAPTTPPPAVFAPAAKIPESVRNEVIFPMPSLEIAPRTISASVANLPFPPEVEVSGVASMAFHNGALWIISDGMRVVKVTGANEIETDFGKIKSATFEFWRYDVARRELKSYRHLFSTNRIPFKVHTQGTNLFVGTSMGVYRIKEPEPALELIGETNTAPATLVAFASTPDRVIFSQGAPRIQSVASRDNSVSTVPLNVRFPFPDIQLAAHENNLLVAAGHIALCDLNRGEMELITNNVTAGSLPERPLEPVACAADDENGFWLGDRWGLQFIDARTKGITHRWISPRIPVENPFHESRRFRSRSPAEDMAGHFLRWRQWREAIASGRVASISRPTTRLAAPVSALANDREFLWIVSGGGLEWWLMLFHKPSESWVGQIKVPGYVVQNVSAITVSEDSVWLGLQQNRVHGGLAPLLQIRKRDLTQVPSSEWMRDAIASNELSRVEGWKNREQGVYAFFDGNYAKVVQLLATAPPQQLDLSTLYLLGCSYDSLGLKSVDKARPYFAEIIAREPQSPWATEATKILAELDKNTALKSAENK